MKWDGNVIFYSPPVISFLRCWSCRAARCFEHQVYPATVQKQSLAMSERSWMGTDLMETGSHQSPPPWAPPPLCPAPSLAASGSLYWWRRRCIPGTESLQKEQVCSRKEQVRLCKDWNILQFWKKQTVSEANLQLGKNRDSRFELGTDGCVFRSSSMDFLRILRNDGKWNSMFDLFFTDFK